MTAAEFADLSARVFRDLTAWVTEASKGETLSTSDLALLQSSMKVIERATYMEAEGKPDTAN